MEIWRNSQRRRLDRGIAREEGGKPGVSKLEFLGTCVHMIHSHGGPQEGMSRGETEQNGRNKGEDSLGRQLFRGFCAE